MLCYVMLCYVMLCYVMLCYVRHVSNALETMSSTLVCIGNHMHGKECMELMINTTSA